ncbi:MAG: pyrroloquinoline quinone-dependent dehydrogenase [Gemmatimonadota bacterium]
MPTSYRVIPALLALAAAATPCAAQFGSLEIDPSGRWAYYGGDPGGAKYSPLDQINRDNVRRMKVAWLKRTGDISDGPDSKHPTAFEATPIVVDTTLYINTPKGRVLAFDAETGKFRWYHDIKLDENAGYGDFTSRGVAFWADTAESMRGKRCRRRIFVAPIDARIVALDADSGKKCSQFGRNGEVDLREGLTYRPRWKGEYETTSPVTVVGDVIVVGSAVADNNRTDAPNGVVRGFDARSGRLLWTWDPIPLGPGAPGGANAWAPFTADLERGLVFVPTGSASPDYFGGLRPGTNARANSVTALKAATGEMVWTFQVVRHDLWDYDVPAQPALFTLRRDGKAIPAVAVPTKMGHLFILDRLTGEPLFPVEERPVPASDVPGEQAWPTQLFPRTPAPLVPQSLTPEQAFGLSDSTRAWCRERIAALRAEGIFTPPSLKGTLVFPGNIGGMNWSGMAIDTVRGIAVVPTNRLAAAVRLIPREDFDRVARTRAYGDGEYSRMDGTPFGLFRRFLLAPDRVPCNPPPWGALTAIDLNTGEVKWEVPLGSLPWLALNPDAEKWGSPFLGGGPLVTAGGLVVMAGTFDGKIRVFDIDTGAELMRANLPAAGNASPITYRVTPSGRQYVVIAAGGHGRLGTTTGDYIVAFALP